MITPNYELFVELMYILFVFATFLHILNRNMLFGLVGLLIIAITLFY